MALDFFEVCFSSLPVIALEQRRNPFPILFLRSTARPSTDQMTLERIRILIVDDHPLVKEGLATVIRNERDMVLVGEASNGVEAIQRFEKCRPDVTLMDLRLPDRSGIDAMVAIRSKFPEARVIILTTFAGDAEIQRALRSGASSYVLKTMRPIELMEVIRRVYAGKTTISPEVAVCMAEHYTDDQLTLREVGVLRQLAIVNRTRDIAKHFSISEDTVKSHIRQIIEKLGANGRVHALAIAVRRGIVQL